MKIITGAPCGFYCFLSWHVLRQLRHWKEIKGEKVNINLPQGKNIYWDISKGNNVWEYYYQQIDDVEGMPTYLHERDMPNLDLYKGMNIRQTLGALYKKYIKYNKNTQEIIDNDAKRLSNYNGVLGVHIRKTDKYNEDPESYPIEDSDVLNVVNKALSEGSYEKIYVATDDQETYNMFIKEYGDRVIQIKRIRGKNAKSVHHHMPEYPGYMKGLDAIRDMEALSKCDFLVRCTSNLSATSMVLNQDIECYQLNTIFRDDKREQESFNIYSKPFNK